METKNYETENKATVSLQAFAAALNDDLYDYLCEGCKDGWDCDWDKLYTRLKPGIDIEEYSEVKMWREILKRLMAGMWKNMDFKATVAKMLAGSFSLMLKLPNTEEVVRSRINRNPVGADYFAYLLFAE